MVATGIMMRAAFPVEEASKRALSELYEQFRDLRRGGTPSVFFVALQAPKDVGDRLSLYRVSVSRPLVQI